MKQEISAISDAIDNRDMEFLAQYGGMGEAGKRYMALRKLPEAELAEGVSIDELFDVPGNTVCRSDLRGQIRGVFRGT